MPYYVYQCRDCSTKFEVRRSFDDSPAACCPACHGEGQLIFQPVPVIFKGTGFYTTDSRKDRQTPQGPESARCP